MCRWAVQGASHRPAANRRSGGVALAGTIDLRTCPGHALTVPARCSPAARPANSLEPRRGARRLDGSARFRSAAV